MLAVAAHAQPSLPGSPAMRVGAPLRDGSDTVRIEVLSDGVAIDSAVLINSIYVERDADHIPNALITIDDGDGATGSWPVTDGTTFEPGSTITILAGHSDPAGVIFVGLVDRIGIRVGRSGTSTMLVHCQNAAAKMAVGANSATYRRMTDADIITQVINRNGLRGRVGATSDIHDRLVQTDSSDWDFIVARAAASGMRVTATDGEIVVAVPAHGPPRLSARLGESIFEYDAEVTGNPAALGQVRGEVQLRGTALAYVGETIAVAGVGNRFSGNVIVTGVTHAIANGDWRTTIRFGPLASPISPATE